MEHEESVQVKVTTVVRELSKYKLDLVSVQEVRWDKGGTAGAGIKLFSMEKEMKIIYWEQDIFLHQIKKYQQLTE